MNSRFSIINNYNNSATDSCIYNILRSVENFVPKSWNGSSDVQREQLMTEIALQVTLMREELESENAKYKKHMNMSRKRMFKLSTSAEFLERKLPGTQLGNAMLKLIQILYDFVESEKISDGWFEEKKLALGQLKDSLLSISDLFPTFISQSAQNVSKRMSDDLNIEFKGTPIAIKHEILYSGSWQLYLQKELKYHIIQKINRLALLTSTLRSFLSNTITDSPSCFLLIQSYLGSIKDVTIECLDDIETFRTIANVNINIYTTQPKINGNIPDPTSWDNTVETYDSMSSPKDKYRPCSLNNAIARLVADYDTNYVAAFFIGYNNFCTPADFFVRLSQYYVNAHQDVQVKSIIGSVILHWIRQDYTSFDRNLISQIKSFARRVLRKDGFIYLSSEIVEELEYNEKKPIKTYTKVRSLYLHSIEVQAHQLLSIWDEKSVADQLTLIDLEIYRSIQATELLGQKWTKEGSRLLAPNLTALLQRVNKISYWFAHMILLQEKTVDRIKILTKIINIASRLASVCNFNGLLGILVGLNIASISRLKHTFSGLSKKYSEELTRLMLYQEPSQSFRFLRNTIKQSSTLVPYVGIYLSDLVAIDENAEFSYVNNMPQINLYKYQLISNSIYDLLRYQESSSTTDIKRIEPLYTFLYELPSLNEKELYQLSLDVEPREANG